MTSSIQPMQVQTRARTRTDHRHPRRTLALLLAAVGLLGVATPAPAAGLRGTYDISVAARFKYQGHTERETGQGEIRVSGRRLVVRTRMDAGDTASAVLKLKRRVNNDRRAQTVKGKGRVRFRDTDGSRTSGIIKGKARLVRGSGGSTRIRGKYKALYTGGRYRGAKEKGTITGWKR